MLSFYGFRKYIKYDQVMAVSGTGRDNFATGSSFFYTTEYNHYF